MEKISQLTAEQLSVVAERHRYRQDSWPMELISAVGEFNLMGLTDFTQSVELREDGISYAVVAIMGPQSSGKSTLLNHLFHTKFTEMDSENGRSQTTKGIWIAKAPVMEQFTMILDLEGTDGQERGEDGTTFEKQSALFALEIADIFIINMWCKDIGLERGANRPLLKTIFEVKMGLFSPRKTTLLYVLRDKTKTPFETLKINLIKDVHKIWEVVPKLPVFKDALLSDFFNVEVTALSNYEYKEEQFKEEVAQLRQQFFHPMSPIGPVGDRPASKFANRAKSLWETIKQNKNLDLPAMKVMSSTVRCDEIAKTKLNRFESHQGLKDVMQDAEIKLVPSFGETISSILKSSLLEYDSETKSFEESVRKEKRQSLESAELMVVYPAYRKTLGHLRSEAYETFRTELKAAAPVLIGGGFSECVRTCQNSCVLSFNLRCLDVASLAQSSISDAVIEQAKREASIVRKKLLDDIQDHILEQVVEQCREQLATKLSEQLNPPFVTVNAGQEWLTWDDVRNILNHESVTAASALSSAVAAFELTDQASVRHKVHDIEQYARKYVQTKFKDAAQTIRPFMTQRFANALGVSYPEMKDNVKKKNLDEAYRKCLKLLSTMAVLRFDNTAYGDDDDAVERVLMSALMDGDGGALSGTTWKGVTSEMTLIRPCECEAIWEEFQTDTKSMVSQTKDGQLKVDWKMVLTVLNIGLKTGLTIASVSTGIPFDLLDNAHSIFPRTQ